MKMIARMFCAAALVLGALSLTGCGDKDAKKDDKGSTTNKPAVTAPTNAPKVS